MVNYTRWLEILVSRNILAFLLRSRCLRMLTAFLMREYKSSGRSGAKPLALRILKILLPVTWRTCATPCESRSNTPRKDSFSKSYKSFMSTQTFKSDLHFILMLQKILHFVLKTKGIPKKFTKGSHYFSCLQYRNLFWSPQLFQLKPISHTLVQNKGKMQIYLLSALYSCAHITKMFFQHRCANDHFHLA